MSHVTERLAEFIFEELSASEMSEAERHLSECANCREQVDRFRQTLSMLEAVPDVSPPRNIVFEFEKPAPSRIWRWFPAAAAVAALLVMAIALAGRMHIQWHDSQLTIAFGETAPTIQPDQAAELSAEIQRLKGNVLYLESKQQEVERNTIVIASRIPPATRAQGSPTGD
jgi:anti-sigma factor RsiW